MLDLLKITIQSDTPAHQIASLILNWASSQPTSTTLYVVLEMSHDKNLEDGKLKKTTREKLLQTATELCNSDGVRFAYVNKNNLIQFALKKPLG